MRNGVIAFLIVGCASRGDDGGGGCNGGGGASLVFEARNNYTFDDADMTFGRVALEEAADFCFDWSAMTTDIRGRPLDPTSIEQVLLVDFSFSEDDLTTKIVEENFVPQEGALPWIFENAGGTSGCTPEMAALNNNYDPVDDDPDDPDDPPYFMAGEVRTWMLSLATLPGSTPEVQQVMILDPTAGETTHDAVFNDGESSITIDANLGSPPIDTQAGRSPYTLDWGDLKKDVNGKSWDNLVGDKLFIVKYDGTIADIEADFLLLDYNATELYELDVRGKTSAILDEAFDVDGNTFPGFTTDGTWLVGMGCSTCISPVPLAIAVVNVAPE